jgi:putative oxidoreductase
MFPNLKVSLAPFILRLGLAVIFLYHGYLKIGFNSGSNWNTRLDERLQLVVAWGELAGGAILALGLLSRLASVLLACEQIGAIVFITEGLGFVQLRPTLGRVVERGGYPWDVGYEYNFAIIAMCLTLLVLGSGKWSVDYLIFHGRKKAAATPESARVPANV